MKPLIFVFILIGFSLYAEAQNTYFFKAEPMQSNKLQKLLRDTLSRRSLVPYTTKEKNMLPQTGVLKILLKGTLVHQNFNGDKTYSMSVDNMACLVPGKQFVDNMPGSESAFNNNFSISELNNEKKDGDLYKGNNNK